MGFLSPLQVTGEVMCCETVLSREGTLGWDLSNRRSWQIPD